MTQAHRCDRCGEFAEGRDPFGVLRQRRRQNVEYPDGWKASDAELCRDCFGEVWQAVVAHPDSTVNPIQASRTVDTEAAPEGER